MNKFKQYELNVTKTTTDIFICRSNKEIELVKQLELDSAIESWYIDEKVILDVVFDKEINPEIKTVEQISSFIKIICELSQSKKISIVK
jgi:hypothetical protein